LAFAIFFTGLATFFFAVLVLAATGFASTAFWGTLFWVVATGIVVFKTV
jgi:hypothetical protein